MNGQSTLAKKQEQNSESFTLLSECELGIARWNAKIKEARIDNSCNNLGRLLHNLAFEINKSETARETWARQYGHWQLCNPKTPPSEFLLHGYIAYSPAIIPQKDQLKLVIIDMISDSSDDLLAHTDAIEISYAGKAYPDTFQPCAKETSNVIGGASSLSAKEARQRICNWHRFGSRWTKKTLSDESVDLFFRGFSFPYVDLVALEIAKSLTKPYAFLALKNNRPNTKQFERYRRKGCHSVPEQIELFTPELIFATLTVEEDDIEELQTGVDAENAALPIPPFKPGDQFSLYETSGGYVTNSNV